MRARIDKDILCTLGPASFNETVIHRLSELDITLFRINLSHTSLEELPDVIERIRGVTSVPICIDTEGAQIRTGDLVDDNISLAENAVVRAHRRRVPGDFCNFNFYPRDAIDLMEIGDFISIDFNSALLQVTGLDEAGVLMRVLNGGRVGRNKAVTVQRDLHLPPLTEKDRAAIEISIGFGIQNFALSFANRGEDVAAFRALVGADAYIISKIECLNGLKNIEAIVALSDALLIDRGDLSREVPLEQIPRIQKGIIEKGHDMGVKVYVATNLLESMVVEAEPTRAEINDIYNTLADGADGLVLAAETAIGSYPVRCAHMIVKMIRENAVMTDQSSYLPTDPFSLLVAPHGGRLVNRMANEDDLRGITDLTALVVDQTDLMDCEQIANGTYSPVDGFMDAETVESVLSGNRLPNGSVWTMPIILQVPKEKARGLSEGDRIALKSAAGVVHALLDVNEVFRPDLENLTMRWFGTSSLDHPGAHRILAGGEIAVGGKLKLVAPLPSPFKSFELTPRNSRFVFSHKGWSRVVGFHTRNICHRGHEYIQLKALEDVHADGLYINPVVGPKKANDFLPEPVLRSYQVLFDFAVYPRNSYVLGGLSSYSRYAGPREAVFTALCRKNMGCSHFIVGRDHTGVGAYYSTDANAQFFDAVGDIGIIPLFFDAIGFNLRTKTYEPLGSSPDVVSISGTQVREVLESGERVPAWMVRDVVQDMLLEERAAGHPLLHD